MKYGSFLSTILLLLSVATVQAANIQDLIQLKMTVESYALSNNALHQGPERRTEVKIGKLDPRLRLTACDSALIAFTPPGSRLQGNSTVGIRCDSPKPWSIYIPVKISIFEQAIIATAKMRRGQIIGENDIILEEVDISRARGRSFINKNDLIGTRVKTSITTNQVIDSTSICLICKGDSVVITADNSAVVISVTGVALNDGGRGDKIRVQNNTSKRIIDAIITDVGTVNVSI